MKKNLLNPSNIRFFIMSITGTIILILFFLMPSYLFGYDRYPPPMHLAAVVQSSCQVKLHWTDCYSNEKGFLIYRKSGIRDQSRLVHTAKANETSWIDTSVEPGSGYFYLVKALISGRRWFYPHVYIMTPEEPGTVPASPLNLTADSAVPGKVNLTWSDLSYNEYGFRIERTYTGGEFTIVTEVPANVISAVDSDNALLPGTEYMYRIIAFNPAGDSLPTNEAKVIIPSHSNDPPDAPLNLTCMPVSLNMVSITWTDNSCNEQSFFVERSPGNGREFTLIKEIPPDTEYYCDTGLLENTSYRYRVRAGNVNGFSDYTPEGEVTTMSSRKIKPKVPSCLVPVVKSTAQINLSWVRYHNMSLQK